MSRQWGLTHLSIDLRVLSRRSKSDGAKERKVQPKFQEFRTQRAHPDFTYPWAHLPGGTHGSNSLFWPVLHAVWPFAFDLHVISGTPQMWSIHEITTPPETGKCTFEPVLGNDTKSRTTTLKERAADMSIFYFYSTLGRGMRARCTCCLYQR